MRIVLLGVLGLAACQTEFVVDSPSHILPSIIPTNAFETLKPPAGAHAELCDPGTPPDPTFPDRADRITNRFCQDVKGGKVPTPTSLQELLVVLGLDFKDPKGGNGGGTVTLALAPGGAEKRRRAVALPVVDAGARTQAATGGTPRPPDGCVRRS